MIENEFKIMLTEEQYNAVHALFRWDGELKQVNSYYDSPDLRLNKRSITCRVRSVSGKYLLQMKLPAGELKNGAVSRVELEREVDGIPRSISGGELTEMSGAEDLPDVALLGELSTVRSVKRFPGAEIDLDKSGYFGRTDYELEIEYTDEAAARSLLDEIAEHTAIDAAASAAGKVQRFLREYIKLRNG